MADSESLTNLITIAHDMHQHLSDIIALKNGAVHFRPTANGVTMVGLSPDRPQRGKGGYKADQLKSNFDEEFEKHCVNIPQGRPTPEKQLQSYLISDAYRHNRQMMALQSLLPPAEKTSLIFVTDEISLAHGGQKIVCDILALNRTSTGDIPVLMELKSERAMTRLIQQLNDYVAVINAYHAQYEALFSALLGRGHHIFCSAGKMVSVDIT